MTGDYASTPGDPNAINPYDKSTTGGDATGTSPGAESSVDRAMADTSTSADTTVTRDDTTKSSDKASGKSSSFGDKMKVIGFTVLGFAVMALISVTLVPTWWSNFVAGIVNESLVAGIFGGLAVGFIFTALPIFIIAMGLKGHPSWSRGIIVAILAGVAAFPNIATLAVMYAGTESSQAGKLKLTQEAPGFQGWSLAGMAIGVVVSGVVWYTSWSRRRNKAKVQELKASTATNTAAG